MGLNLTGTISLDGAGFERGLHRAGEHVTDFVKNAAVAAFGFYGVEQAIHHTVETASELVNEAKRLDLTVEQLQLLRQAAKDGGVEMTTLASAFEKLDIARAKALAGGEGGKSALKAFKALGVSREDLKTRTSADLFTGPISKIAKSGNAESLAPILKEIFGKSFGQVLPVLRTDFEELSDKMHKLGTLMDADTAVKLKALGDNFDLLKNILTIQLGPVLITVVEIFLQLVGALKSFGAYLGTFAGSDKPGFIKGTASIGKELVDSVIDKVPGKLGDALQTASDNYYKNVFDLTPEQATSNVMDIGAAADAASEAQKKQAEDWKAMIDKMREDLSKSAKAIEHPKPIEDDVAPAKGKKVHAPEDALVKVGNFLGATGNVISRVDQRKIELHEATNSTLQKLGIVLSNISESATRTATAVEKASFGTGGIGVPP